MTKQPIGLKRAVGTTRRKRKAPETNVQRQKREDGCIRVRTVVRRPKSPNQAPYFRENGGPGSRIEIQQGPG